MKKIITGIVGLVLTVAVVAGVGYALFSSQVSVTGMVLGTATPSLKISQETLTSGEWRSTMNVGNIFAKLLPGESDWGEFELMNQSNGTTDPMDFNLTGQITAAGGDWELLKDAIQLRVCTYDDAAANNCGTPSSDSRLLSWWNASPRQLPGGPLLQGELNARHYVLVFYIDSAFGNDIAGKTISGMNMEVVGTQVP